MSIESRDHLYSFIDNYTTFVFSIYGILHDGRQLNSHAYQCLLKLGQAGKRVAIFSNVPRRRSTVIAELMQMGVPPSLYQHIVTAGEQTWLSLKERHDPFSGTLGYKCYYIGPAASLNILEDLPYCRVSSIEQADFVLVMGLDEWHTDLNYYFDILNQALDLDLPLVCGSSDEHVYSGKEIVIRAGAIAKFYQDRGGPVFFHGKPQPAFYKALMDELKPLTDQKILIIGDSLKTDIAGAQSARLDSLLIINKTALQELNLQTCRQNSLDEISLKIIETNCIPRYVMRTLQW